MSFAGRALTGPDAVEILKKAMSVSDRLAFEGKQMVTMWFDTRTEATITHEHHQGRGRYRIEYLAPRQARGRLVISDGRIRWQYEPRSGRTLISSTDTADFSEEFLSFSLSLLLSNYRLSLEPHPSTVAGRKAYVLSIIPKYRGKPTRRLWVDVATGLVLKTERAHSDGAPASISAYSEIQYRSGLPDSLFHFRPPYPGRIVRKMAPVIIHSPKELHRRLGAWVMLPRSLAAGYRFQNATIQSLRGKSSVQLNYSDGLSTLSLVEIRSRSTSRLPASSRPVRVGSQKGWLISNRHFEILTWHNPKAGLTLSLVGDLNEKTLLEIARSIPVEPSALLKPAGIARERR